MNLLSPAPIPAVSAALAQAHEHAPIPTSLNPGSPAQVGSEGPSQCVPRFGPGLSYRICHLGATRSRHLVVVLGDSHAYMWMPALLPSARELDFDLVPLAKAGCAVWSLDANRPGWPCQTWYRGVLRTIARLRPAATLVSFMTANFTTRQAAFAATATERVLAAVPHPVLLADTPSDAWYGTHLVPPPEQCLSSPTANQGACAMPEAPQVSATLGAIQAMVNRDRYPAIPTLQWFCGDGICPTIIDGTVTSEDGNHITPEYMQLLAPRLADRLRPILHHLFSQPS